ncbi:hypothetical protein BC828DRAFT_388622 [Blastocladiella britannica]|nr:hypothetical protein BC828DRAFT_388622 [Blastocladiella britannica]
MSEGSYPDWITSTTVPNDPSTSALLRGLHVLALVVVLVGLPFTLFVLWDMFVSRRRSLWGPIATVSGRSPISATQGSPRSSGGSAVAIRPFPTECMVFFLTMAYPFAVVWHLLLVFRPGEPLIVPYLVLCLRNIFQTSAAAVHLVGVLHTIPVFMTDPKYAAALAGTYKAHKSGNLQARAFRFFLVMVPLPSPLALQRVVMLLMSVHFVFNILCSIMLGMTSSAETWVAAYTAEWASWIVTLTLFGSTSMVYSLKIIWIFACHESERTNELALKSWVASSSPSALPVKSVLMTAAGSLTSPLVPVAASPVTVGPPALNLRTNNTTVPVLTGTTSLPHRSTTIAGNLPSGGTCQIARTASSVSPATSAVLIRSASSRITFTKFAPSAESHRKLALRQLRLLCILAPSLCLSIALIAALNVAAVQLKLPARHWVWLAPAMTQVVAGSLTHTTVMVILAAVAMHARVTKRHEAAVEATVSASAAAAATAGAASASAAAAGTMDAASPEMLADPVPPVAFVLAGGSSRGTLPQSGIASSSTGPTATTITHDALRGPTIPSSALAVP